MMLLPLLFLVAPSFVQATCYAPNGLAMTNQAYQPCISVDGVHSMCCALNRTEVGGVADVCQQNGLCTSEGIPWRGFCTDQNWDSPGCLPKNICDDTTGGTSSNSNQLTRCQDGTYCCNGGNTTCCSNNRGFKLNPTLISINTASSSPSPSSTKSLSNPSSTSESSPNNCVSATCTSSPSTNATTVGVGVGVPLAVLAILGSMAGFWLGQRRGKRIIGAIESRGGVDVSALEGKGLMGFSAPTEVTPSAPPQELRASQPMPVELGTSSRDNKP